MGRRRRRRSGRRDDGRQRHGGRRHIAAAHGVVFGHVRRAPPAPVRRARVHGIGRQPKSRRRSIASGPAGHGRAHTRHQGHVQRGRVGHAGRTGHGLADGHRDQADARTGPRPGAEHRGDPDADGRPVARHERRWRRRRSLSYLRAYVYRPFSAGPIRGGAVRTGQLSRVSLSRSSVKIQKKFYRYAPETVRSRLFKSTGTAYVLVPKVLENEQNTNGKPETYSEKKLPCKFQSPSSSRVVSIKI